MARASGTGVDRTSTSAICRWIFLFFYLGYIAVKEDILMLGDTIGVPIHIDSRASLGTLAVHGAAHDNNYNRSRHDPHN